jgi:heat shock protein HslJ
MWRAGVLFAILAAVVAGCGDAQDPRAGASPAPAAGLEGRSFASTAGGGHRLVPGSRVTIAFEAGRLSANAGCNTLSGGWSVADGRLRTDGELAQTQIACDEALMDQDDWLSAFLSGAPRVALDGERLTLSGDSATLELIEAAPDGPRPIAGTRWRLTTLGRPDGTVSSVPAGVKPPTLLIDADGVVELFAGCNSGGGRAEVRDDGFIDFGSIALTRMACGRSAMAVELAVVAMLDGRVAAGFSGEGDLSLARGGKHLVFAPED